MEKKKEKNIICDLSCFFCFCNLVICFVDFFFIFCNLFVLLFDIDLLKLEEVMLIEMVWLVVNNIFYDFRFKENMLMNK